MPNHRTATLLLSGLLSTSLALGACSSDRTTTTTDLTSPAATTGTGAAATDPTTDPATDAAVATTGAVDANTATAGELVAALEAAGVDQADRWAREIEEYRPYDASDPSLAHLRDELAKYNPDADTLAGILSVLQVQ